MKINSLQKTTCMVDVWRVLGTVQWKTLVVENFGEWAKQRIGGKNLGK